jgi:ionotropic glutamate receptor NMDA 2B
VGSWYAMTGYGIGFPKASKWIPLFNEHLMVYRENGDLERLQKFWFTGRAAVTTAESWIFSIKKINI